MTGRRSVLVCALVGLGATASGAFLVAGGRGWGGHVSAPATSVVTGRGRGPSIPPELDTNPAASLSLPAAAGPPASGTVTGWLTVPRLGLTHVPIVDEGLDGRRSMLISPGFTVTHYAYSARLGQGSNAVLYGHDDIQGEVFRDIGRLRPGDTVIVDPATGGRATYTVRGSRIVSPSSVSILDATPTPILTLFTCYPYRVDTQRIVVTAALT